MAVGIGRELGLRALAPLLPGHGSSVDDLAQTRFADWRRGAQEAFESLPSGPVIVIGSSMGSLLALDLTADQPERVIGVVALATALRLGWLFPSLALSVMAALRLPDFSLPKAGADIRDPCQRKSQVTYGAQPAHAGNEVRLAGPRVERRLGQIRCPALLVHGRHDHVCPLRGARRAFSRLGTPRDQKELVILDRSYHIVTRDVERGIVRTKIHDFVRRLAGTSHAA